MGQCGGSRGRRVGAPVGYGRHEPEGRGPPRSGRDHDLGRPRRRRAGRARGRYPPGRGQADASVRGAGPRAAEFVVVGAVASLIDLLDSSDAAVGPVAEPDLDVVCLAVAVGIDTVGPQTRNVHRASVRRIGDRLLAVLVALVDDVDLARGYAQRAGTG